MVDRHRDANASWIWRFGDRVIPRLVIDAMAGSGDEAAVQDRRDDSVRARRAFTKIVRANRRLLRAGLASPPGMRLTWKAVTREGVLSRVSATDG
jgi:hypothetical protein